ncbi:hypothetical protein KJ359_010271 [Pestalotiopsis sp. 9143b]|nr:hypothetical protein KJ359_010271 [Pestalotiopsis sp. 9143b]
MNGGGGCQFDIFFSSLQRFHGHQVQVIRRDELGAPLVSLSASALVAFGPGTRLLPTASVARMHVSWDSNVN